MNVNKGLFRFTLLNPAIVVSSEIFTCLFHCNLRRKFSEYWNRGENPGTSTSTVVLDLLGIYKYDIPE